MNVVFMGTPEFAVNSLEMLTEEHNVLAVFTKPDKPKGRGYEMCPPPIKVKALEQGIPVYQPASVKGEDTLELLKELNPDVIVVVAYGKILPPEILKLPRFGCINVHASLLPRHRGASPIQWAIVSGDKVTGVTTQLMAEGIDTGDILVTSVTNIDSDDTADSLHDKLAVLGAKTLKSTLAYIETDELLPLRQCEEDATYAPIIKKEMALIDFTMSMDEIDCRVRGFNSWPCAYFYLNGKRIKVYKVKKCDSKGNIGEVIECENRLVIGCKDGSVELLEVQPEGKRRMNASDMLRGWHIEKGAFVGEN